MSSPLQAYPLRIIGIDPGSHVAGFAILGAIRPDPLQARDFVVLDAGIVRLSTKLPAHERLGQLHEAYWSLVQTHQPQHCAIEKAFHGVNVLSALRLGEARGACIAAVRRFKTQVHELAPTTIKKAITGRGHATKEELAMTLKLLLGFERGHLPLDVTDALGMALTLGLSLATMSRTTMANPPPRRRSSTPCLS